jgi:hypothetical protein
MTEADSVLSAPPTDTSAIDDPQSSVTKEMVEQLERLAKNFRVRVPHQIGIDLEDMGLAKWHPGSGYEITGAGRAALAPFPGGRSHDY